MRAFALITLPPESWRRGRHGLERPHRRELHDQRLGRGGPEFSAHALRIQSGDPRSRPSHSATAIQGDQNGEVAKAALSRGIRARPGRSCGPCLRGEDLFR
jgi:hypothetical protein